MPQNDEHESLRRILEVSSRDIANRAREASGLTAEELEGHQRGIDAKRHKTISDVYNTACWTILVIFWIGAALLSFTVIKYVILSCNNVEKLENILKTVFHYISTSSSLVVLGLLFQKGRQETK